MDDLIYLFHYFIHNYRVANVAFDKRVIRVVFKVFEIGGISGIGQFVKVYNLIIWIFLFSPESSTPAHSSEVWESFLMSTNSYSLSGLCKEG